MKVDLVASALFVSITLAKHGVVSAETVRGKVPQRKLQPLVLVGETGNPFKPFNDICKWETGFYGSGIDVYPSKHKVHFTVAKNAIGAPIYGGSQTHADAHVKSMEKLSGDFEVQVDFELIKWPFQSGVRAGLIAMNDSGNSVVISYVNYWEYYGDIDPTDDNKFVFHAGDAVGGGPSPLVVDADPQDLTEGSLKLIRIDSTTRGYFLKNGIWEQVGNGSIYVDADDVWLKLQAWGNDFTFQHMHDASSTDTVAEVKFDHLEVNSGDVIPFEGPGCFPLGMCEGDCDNDAHCQPHLRCFKREPESDNVVPGCSGGESDDPGKDYCTARDLWLSKVGDHGRREDNGELMVDDPLGLCEGDCDDDNQCKPGLKCFKRNGNTTIPGCWNVGGDPGEDYCIYD